MLIDSIAHFPNSLKRLFGDKLVSEKLLCVTACSNILGSEKLRCIRAANAYNAGDITSFWSLCVILFFSSI
ncbi:unnamed protein product [Rhizophagus irregularis]|nr:unnamed protein product [Rhizophagus irregularis]CAB5196831.1 unnamed protein product [Rhizophagus irregularis]